MSVMTQVRCSPPIRHWLAVALALAGLFGCTGDLADNPLEPGLGEGMPAVEQGDGDEPREVACLGSALVDGPISFAAANGLTNEPVVPPTAVDVADVNGDGYPDIGAFKSNLLAWFEAPTSGTGNWPRRPLPPSPTSRPFLGAAKFADIDSDGDIDVVASLDNHSTDPKSAYVYWWQNPGKAMVNTSSAWQVHPIAQNLPVHHINDMVIADMDGDTKPDVVVRSLDPNRLYLFFQNSGTSWTTRFIDSSPYGATGEGFAVGDIDRAGKLDISICGHWLQAPSDPRTGTYAAFSIDANYKTVNANVKEAIGDIDGDGRMDVIISPAEGYRNGGTQDLAWYKAPADPTAVTSWTRSVLRSGMNGGHTILLGDMDADGDLDAVSGIAWNMWNQTSSITVYFNLGGGSFSSGQTVANDKGLYTGVLADIGADGDLDIVGQETYGGLAKVYLYESLEASGQAPTCSDGRLNQGEQDVDCGGPCPACPMPMCGNGMVEAGEQCDDGNGSDSDHCNNHCVRATCSDLVRNQGETEVDCGGPCASCQAPAVCGDGTVQMGEECDDGNANDTDSCSNGCVMATCDDGVQNQAELGVDCGGPCAACPGMPMCGNGVVESGEQCDDGNPNDADACSNLCIRATCRDGRLNQGEAEVDCGGPCPACGASGVEGTCGDGVVEGVEECDDGNDVDEDGCLSTCVAASCTDGFVQVGVEACDDGNVSNDDQCLNDCSVAECGDGLVVAGVEECDDGNDEDADSCDSACRMATCDDGVKNHGESDVDCDGPCPPCAAPAECGNGVTEAGEQCDDGNGDKADDCVACRWSTCEDGLRNRDEEGIDCGGLHCKACAGFCSP